MGAQLATLCFEVVAQPIERESIHDREGHAPFLQRARIVLARLLHLPCQQAH